MKYTDLLPFMNKEELKKVAFEIINGELKNVRLQRLFPFLGKEALGEIVDVLIEKKETKYLEHAIPFVGREKVQAIYNTSEKGEIPGFNSAMCIPFLGTDKIKELFRELVQKANDGPDEDDDEDDEDEDI